MDTKTGQVAPDDEWKGAEAVLEKWNRRAREAQTTQHEAAKTKRKQHSVLGIVTTVLSVVATTSAFTSLFDKAGTAGKATTAVFALSSSIALGIQTFLKLEEKANAHNLSRAGYGSVRRLIEEISGTPRKERGTPKEALARVRTELDRLGKEASVAELDNAATEKIAGDYNSVFSTVSGNAPNL